MILQRLVEYYDRLIQDPAQDVPTFGFGPQKIAFALVLERDGSLHSIDDLRLAEGKAPRPRQMDELPVKVGERRTSATSAQFLWDRPDYLLGWSSAETSQAKVSDRFEACRDLHLRLLEGSSSEIGKAVRKFYQSWQPEAVPARYLDLLAEVEKGFGVFVLRGTAGWAHENAELRRLWQQHLEEGGIDTDKMICLITGEPSIPARLHDAIKGVQGAQSSGASMVSFNLNAFVSRGQEQGANAPIGREASFKFSAALNRLLDREHGRRVRIGDATVVYWATQPTEVSGMDLESMFGWVVEGGHGEDEDRARHIGRVLEDLAAGRAEVPDDGTRFFVLGLSPNAARIAVRFWFDDSLSDVVRRITRFQRELEIVRGPRDVGPISIWRILRETGRETKDIPPLLAGSLTRAVLSGGRYPQALLNAVIRRIRADRRVSLARAATIKAFLVRNHDLEVPIMLDSDRPDPGYQLGRLFACLEKAQQDALPGINATIKDRYFAAASATPAAVFPRLLRSSQHHMRKLDGGFKVNAEKRVQNVMSRIESFPRVLGLEGQGQFALGYYHQRLDFFTKKSSTGDAASSSVDNEPTLQ